MTDFGIHIGIYRLNNLEGNCHRADVRSVLFLKRFSLFLRTQNRNFIMAGVRRYLLLWVCVVTFLLKETSCTNEESKVNRPDRSSKTRKRRFLVYPDNGSYAEVMSPTWNTA